MGEESYSLGMGEYCKYIFNVVRNKTVEGCRTRLGEESVLSYFGNLKIILLEWLIEKAGSLRDIKKICFGGTGLGMGKVSMANKF